MKPYLLLAIAILYFFIIAGVSAQVPERAGWWKFDDALNLGKATIGNPRIYF